MLNFLNNKTNKILQNGSVALIVIGALLIITAAAMGVFNGLAPKAIVEVESPQTRAEQKPPVRQTKTSFGAVQGLTKTLLNLNSEITSRSLAQEEKDLKTANLASGVKQRKILIKELMKENPRAFLATALKKDQRAVLPQDIQKDIEQETALTAKIEVLYIDDFKNPENSRFEYFLRIGKDRLNFYPTDELHLISGAEVKIEGFQLDEIIVADTNKNNFQVTKEAPPLESVGDQKTLVLLINFLDSPPIPFTKEQAYDLAFNGQFQNFMKEQSYNKVSFSGDVLDWVTLQRFGATAFACQSITHNELEKILIDNMNPNYGRLLVLSNNNWAGGACSNVGKTTHVFNGIAYNLSIAWSHARFDDVVSHELGHSLGVVHANGWDCGEEILYGDCQHIEYGNYFDIMGAGAYALHFNAFFKELLGWVGLENSLLIDKTGRYTINPLELDNGINLAKIQMKDSAMIPFYVEHRKGIGFDSQLNDASLSFNQSGLFINNIIKRKNWSPIHRILDMSPTSLSWQEDSQQITLNGQSVFEDVGRGITIGPIINTSTSSITFDVEIGNPKCVVHEPILDTFPSYLKINAGNSYFVILGITNQDSLICEGESKFNLTPILPPFWQYEANPPENIFLAPGEFYSWGVKLTIPEDTTPDTYVTKFDVINLRNGLKTSKNITVSVLPPLVVSSINPTKGAIGAEVTVSGSGFDYSNYINFYNQEGSAFMSNMVSDNNTIKFKIPSTIRKYDCDCDISTPAGVYQIAVSTNSAQSNPVDFEVIEPKPLPSLSITTPKDGDAVVAKSKVVITAEVSNEIKDKTKRVEFYVNGARKCQDKTAPYSCNWQVPKKSGQTYELQAKAYGNRKQSGAKPIAESEVIRVNAK